MKKTMVRILSAIAALVVMLSSITSLVSAKSNSNPCDSNCVEKAMAGKMSQDELKYIGYGNVIKAAASTYGGDLTLVLYQLGLFGNNSAGNVNATYGTNIPMEAYDFHLQDDGSIFAYKVDQDDQLHKWICFPYQPCTQVE
jgi:hypothetical protein